ncbi:MAG: ABC transporter ATP-binding protein, partial [Alphaproteobacteria bacterium]|nr:ABC transporter ATP-binding protein [Alphaproteobacteria bacterium]
MAALSLGGISKRFGEHFAVADVDLSVADGELFALLGPSACGKTTLLRLVAGLEEPDSGTIHVGGEEMVGVAANRRPVNMVFQSYALFPHMSVADNVAYGLRVAGMARNETAARVAEALSLVRLDGLENRRPDTLSGGQRQRVALARALVKRPQVLLLDEPLSALDAKLRDEMGQELVRLQKALGIAFVLVTHDQDEALSMADRVAVMNHGRICQVATPADLYEKPESRFVAEFLGAANILEANAIGRA